ncbi:hypothetical protein NDU88_002126 [Pleurodeles waltl]|uniref:Uncharacterized protein n=1 Tax=Pleurodeles waltl TaxID=8319 RepID=A0AAV7PD66_PLEWA|nr:hypothetical protein NDU88_002126 [Pleurodeles waltl]
MVARRLLEPVFTLPPYWHNERLASESSWATECARWKNGSLRSSGPLLTDFDSSFTGAAATGAAASSSGASLRFTVNSPRSRIHTSGPVH